MRVYGKECLLPEDFKEKLIVALRSKQYKQGQGLLYNKAEDSYCFFGVVGAICGIPKEAMACKDFLIELGEFRSNVPSMFYENATHLTPEASIVNTLVNMNDEDLASFEELANWVEEHL